MTNSTDMYRHRPTYLLTLLIMLMVKAAAASAQELEYKYEVGGMLGLGSYMGDADYSHPYKHNELGVSLLGRWNINPRMALKGDLMFTKVSGDAMNTGNKFPDIEGQEWKFDNTLVDCSGMYELNFWGYGTGRSYKGTHRLTPYIALGFGFTYGNSTFSANIPFGCGVKYKLKDRLNVGFDWAIHFSMTDELDGISDPYNIKSGFLKNKDSYITTMLYVSYDICPKYRKCNND